jgi:tRNA(adenine34) deaminase
MNKDRDMQDADLLFLREAIQLAQEAERNRNLPIGAVIVLDGQIIARGMNSIWSPVIELTRHAEMEALRNLPSHFQGRYAEMTLFTTLEPCLMCAGAILLYQIGRVVFGATDPFGGVTCCLDYLPPYFKQVYSQTQWIGPALPEECGSLYVRVQELEQRQSRDST